MLKIGVGPSSSHTLGPWKAVLQWLEILDIEKTEIVVIHLFGSLAKTGLGHATDIAILMGLLGENPTITNTALIADKVQNIQQTASIFLNGKKKISFNYQNHLLFHFDKTLSFHANGLQFDAFDKKENLISSEQYFSVGGGFVVQNLEYSATKCTIQNIQLKYPCNNSNELIEHCKQNNISVYEMVIANELFWRNINEIKDDIETIWQVMLQCVYKGCHTAGTLPGGLEVKRRAAALNKQLIGKNTHYNSPEEWIDVIKNSKFHFDKIIRWISCFAFAVNEENAAMGRVVTAPTNGASGVIPAVIMYLICFSEERFTLPNNIIEQFLCVAGELGTFFKKGATISAAMGGCQAEIGVSSAMAAGALTHCLGGSVEQVLMAAEIAMEHHLGLTCDPIGGLVQIPCIERNSMGAMKAITAANIALESNANEAKVSLDKVIKTMWETAKDMNSKYKETAEGGLAVSVNMVDC